jgi:hypothetical protein
MGMNNKNCFSVAFFYRDENGYFVSDQLYKIVSQ